MDLGDGMTGFLPLKTLPKPPGKKPKNLTTLLHEGQRLIVQITSDATPGKQPKLTARVEIVSPAIVFHPYRAGAYVSSRIKDPDRREELKKFGRSMMLEDYGITFRTDAENIPEDQLSETAAYLINVWTKMSENIKNRKCPSMLAQMPDATEQTLRDFGATDVQNIIIDDAAEMTKAAKWAKTYAPQLSDRIIRYQEKENLFSQYDIDDEIEKIYSKRVFLKSGAWITIEETEALTAVDINMGDARFSTDRGKQIFTLNREAAREIFRQLRLRAIGGIIIIDFVDMTDKGDIKSLQNYVDDLILADPEQMQRGNISSFGLMELTRRSRLLSLNHQLLTTGNVQKNLETECLDLLRSTHANALSSPGKPQVIKVSREMKKWFENHSVLFHDFESKTGSALTMELL